GLAVNTAARICAAGHGGQILLSSDAGRAVEASARNLSFRSLGAPRLQGLPGPQPLLPLEAAAPPGNFPAPPTTKTPRSKHVVRTRSRSRQRKGRASAGS